MLLLTLSLGIGLLAAARAKRQNPNLSTGQVLTTGALAAAGTYAVGKVVVNTVNHLRLHYSSARVFISYHHAPHEALKGTLAAIAESGALGVPLEDRSVTKRIRTKDDARIRADLTRRIRHDTDIVVVLVGPTTASRRYVNHEAQVAVAEGKPIVVVKTDKAARAPQVVYGQNVHWSHVSNPDSIVAAVKAAKRELL